MIDDKDIEEIVQMVKVLSDNLTKEGFKGKAFKEELIAEIEDSLIAYKDGYWGKGAINITESGPVDIQEIDL